MFEKIDWPVAKDFKGERELEVAWIRRQLKGVTGSVIADFGCVNYGSHNGQSRWLGLDVYEQNENNKLLAFDKAEFSVLKDRYICANLMEAGFCRHAYVDVGISVSVIEHIGINCEPRVLSGDFIALRNIYDTIKVGGVLLITVPSARVAALPKEDIRVYSPAVLRSYMRGLFGAKVAYEYYRYIPPFWMVAHDDDGFDEMSRVEVDHSKRIGVSSLACLTIRKC